MFEYIVKERMYEAGVMLVVLSAVWMITVASIATTLQNVYGKVDPCPVTPYRCSSGCKPLTMSNNTCTECQCGDQFVISE